MGWFMQIKLTPPLFSLAPPHPAPSLEFSGTHPFRWHSHHDIPRKKSERSPVSTWMARRAPPQLQLLPTGRGRRPHGRLDRLDIGVACGSLERCVS